MRVRDCFGQWSPRGLAVVALAGTLLTADLAAAQSTGRKTGVIFYTENDDWPPDTGTDKDYTNGFRLTIDRNSDSFRLHRWRMFRWVPKHPSCDEAPRFDNTCISSAFHFGQQFYTPDDISIRELIPNDWPYAGWLYVGGSWRAGSLEKAVISDVYLGFTGDWSLGREVQTQWHKLVSATNPEGWDNQIGTRFGVVAAHSRHWAVVDKYVDSGPRWLEVTPFVGGNVGNIMTDGYAGGRAKIGWNITRDWTHTAIGPAAVSPRASREDAKRPGNFEAFFSVDARGRLVGYNVFLDAAEHHTIHRRPAIGEAAVGVGLRVGAFMLTYRVAKISKEYDEALTHHEFKALRFMWIVR